MKSKQQTSAFYVGTTILLALGLALPTSAQAYKANHKAVISSGVSQRAVADAVLTEMMDDLWDQTDEHFHHGEYNHIINLHRIIVQAQPHRMESYANSAWLLWSTDRNAEAIAFLKQGLQANPKNFYMYDELGAHYFLHLKNPKAAIPYYEKAVQFPCPFATLHALANCYEKTGQWEKAVKTWKRATKYKGDIHALERLKRAQDELARRRKTG